MKHELFPSSENIEEPASLRGRPPRCRATDPSGTGTQFFMKIFTDKPLPPGRGRPGAGRPAAGRPGYILVNFENENIFFKKMKIKNKKNKKTAIPGWAFVF